MSETERRRVLVVDDEQAICFCLAELIEAEGYATATAHDGEEALGWVRDNGPPLAMILDLMMPKLSGWDVLSALTESGAKPTPFPVIVVSAFPSAAKRTVDSYAPLAVFAKPVDVDRLFEALARAELPPSRRSLPKRAAR